MIFPLHFILSLWGLFIYALPYPVMPVSYFFDFIYWISLKAPQVIFLHLLIIIISYHCLFSMYFLPSLFTIIFHIYAYLTYHTVFPASRRYAVPLITIISLLHIFRSIYMISFHFPSIFHMFDIVSPASQQSFSFIMFPSFIRFVYFHLINVGLFMFSSCLPFE